MSRYWGEIKLIIKAYAINFGMRANISNEYSMEKKLPSNTFKIVFLSRSFHFNIKHIH